jgi:NAD(P)H-quinone oxidoreductase subunit 4
VYAVRLFNRVGFGRLDNGRAHWPATVWSERAPALVLTLLVIATGLWPTALTGWSGSATAALALRSQPFLDPSAPTVAIAPELLPS